MGDKGRCAVFTIVKDEAVILPVWLRYYRRYCHDADIFVLDHDSQDGSTEGLAVNVKPVHNDNYLDHQWLIAQIQSMQRKLFSLGYEYVLFAEVDEIVLADPAIYSGLDEYIALLKRPVVRCTGYEMYQHPTLEPAPIDWSRPVFDQRQYWAYNPLYCKPLLSSFPLDWTVGFHTAAGEHPIDSDLLLVHLHYTDLQYTLARHAWKREQKWAPGQGGLSIHNQADDAQIVSAYEEVQKRLMRIPYNFTGRIL